MKRAALACAALLVACAPDFKDASRMLARNSAPPREPVAEQRTTYFDAENTRIRRRWNVLIANDNSTVLHGVDVQYFADGTLEYERSYDHGEQSGCWRAFWPNGKQKMEAEYGTESARAMRWWHESGQLSSEGRARNGLKEGEWTFWHPTGVKASSGNYIGGSREGEWSFFNENGSLQETVQFRGDVQVRSTSPSSDD